MCALKKKVTSLMESECKVGGFVEAIIGVHIESMTIFSLIAANVQLFVDKVLVIPHFCAG